MLRHKLIDRVCCVVLALTLLVSALFVGAAATGHITEDTTVGYETRLFDQSRVHTIDIVIDDWEAFLKTCTSEVYSACHLVIDGESYKNVGIRGKGNTSLSSVAAYGNNRYSFKVEFDQYQTGLTYHGLDKLSLNNLIQDNTYMKDYFAYTLMNKMGVAAPLCSFVQINVNGEPWGLYLAVEGVEEAFLQRNYGKDYGELYKPDSLSFGGGRGNGEGFDMNEMAEQFGFSFGAGEDGGSAMSDMGSMPAMPENSGSDDSFGGSAGGASGESAGNPAATPEPTATATPEPTATPAPTAAPADDSFGGSAGDAASGGEAASGGDAASSGMPAGSEMPAMPSDMPTDGAAPQTPAEGTLPENFDPEQVMGSSGNATATSATEISSVPQMPADGMLPEGFEMPSMDFGGFGGFGSSTDVKLQYSGDDPSSYSNIFNNAKTDVTEDDKQRLIASIKTLNEGDTSVVDTEVVIRYMAVHNFLCNDDSYTGMMVHNYYLYEENGVLSMIPWDYNLGYGGFSGGSNGTSTVNTSISRLVSMGNDSDRPMAGWITASEEYTAQYLAMYQQFMTEVFDSGWFEAEFDRVRAMIDPYVKADPTAFCTYEEFQKGADTLKAFCLKRAESVKRQLQGDSTRVDASELDLSVMGTMNGMGGGFGGPGGGGPGERPKETNAPADDAEAVYQPQRDATRNDFASSGGQAVQGDEAAPAATPEDTEQPADKAERTRPDFESGFSMYGMSRKTTSDAWLWVAISAAMLLVAILLAALYRTNR